MRFYTNVYQIGNSILVRGYENGKSFSDREEFKPTFKMSKVTGRAYLDDIAERLDYEVPAYRSLFELLSVTDKEDF